MSLALALLLAATAPEHLTKGLELLRAGDGAAAHAELVHAFTLDPELRAPPDGAVAAARSEARAGLRTRLDDAAAKATLAFTAPPPKPASLESPRPYEPEPLLPGPTQKLPEKEKPLAAGGRLTVGLFGFWVPQESRGGPAIEASFGAPVGPVRVGGAAAFFVGSSLALSLAARVSTVSQARVAFLAAADLGLFYGGSNALFAPFITAHAAGLRLKAGRVGFEFHIASLSVFWLGGSTFLFVPQSGFAVLL
ncbi:MAG: hypothetical protein JNK82_29280 [Myxococcaceae bacterium]|nr:hypothetical protein [Myxococcaceae bacterium]